jgi:hypothetical protein
MEFKTIWLSSKTQREHPVVITIDFADVTDDWETRPHYIAELSLTWDGENIYNIVPPQDLDELAIEAKDFYADFAREQQRCNEDDYIDPKHIDSWSF